MTPSSLTYDEALDGVRAIVEKSRTSFAAGMASLPKEGRAAMHALYAFCRIVDDIADDSETTSLRAEGLRVWRERLHALFRKGEVSESVTTALLPAIGRYDLREKDFLDIVKGVEMDGPEPIRAPTMDFLDLYCDLVASAVGRISVRIFGDAGEEAQKVAFHLGRAFQLTNILRDLGEDAARGRLYLPRELLEKRDIETSEPEEVLSHPSLPYVCRDLADIAVRHFEMAEEEMKKCRRKAMRPARTMRNYYRALLLKIAREGWKNPQKRVSLSGWEKALVALRSLAG